jgi:hypothetical protein
MLQKHKKIEPSEFIDVDTQHKWAVQYRVDSLTLGRLCSEFPGLQKSWEQFKIVYELCKSENEINRHPT